MKGYAEQALKQFQHLTQTKLHYGPTKYKPPEYGREIQCTTIDTSPELTDKQKNFIQQVWGKFVYNGRGVDV